MEKRAYAVDLLRGLAIVGMVLSGQILWHAELPAWLFHAQVPPPSFRFDPSVPGITWVDLVFPFFLFSMGAAFPLALRKRLEQRGESVALILTVVVRRWALLALFAVALANLRSGVTGTLPGWGSSLLQLAGWGCFCALFMRIDRFSDRQNRMVCLSGVAGIAALLAAARWGWGLPVSAERSDVIILVLANMALFGSLVWLYTRNNLLARLGVLALLAALRLGSGVEGSWNEALSWGLPVSAERSDVIILVLANMALFGSLVWLYTRNNLLARLGVLALLAALRLGSGVEGSWNEALWNWSPVPWLFRFDYLKYLCIIIPGTIAGDRIYEWMTHGGEDAPGASRRREVWTLVLLVTLICLNMWGLFARQLVVNLVAGVLLCLLLRRLLRGDGSATGRLHRSLFGWGFFWLGLGLALEAFEGGIKKDYATFSYFFVTSGLASFVLIAAGIAMRRLNVRFSALVKCGQNPMVAYTAAGFLIMPLLTLLHLSPCLQAFAELCPWMGVARGVLVTAAVMAVTVFFTNRRLFWRT